MEIFYENGNVSRELYVFLRYNQLRNTLDRPLSTQDEAIYQEFNRQVKDLIKSLETGTGSASTQLGNIMNLFGFDRRYCAISGLPIIGKFFKINGKTVSKESYDAWKLVQEMQKIEEIEHQKHDDTYNTPTTHDNSKKTKKGE